MMKKYAFGSEQKRKMKTGAVTVADEDDSFRIPTATEGARTSDGE
jgi:hypothetical protein